MSQAINFIHSLRTGKGISENLAEILKHLKQFERFNVFDFDDSSIFEAIVHIYTTISRIVNVPFKIMVQNTLTTYTLSDMLIEISLNHYHQNLRSEDLRQAHSMKKGKKGKLAGCTHHTEPLIDHLVFASVIACYQSLKSGRCDPLLATFSTLLHDVGKPSCCVSFNNGNYVGYPFHGEIGGMFLSMIYNSSFAQFISKDNWETMTRSVTCHMCSYHSVLSDAFNTLRRELNRFETQDVRDCLHCMSYGDTAAAFPELEEDANRKFFEFIKFQPTYEESVSQPFDPKFFESNGFDGLVICMGGMAKTGKSALADELLESFPDAVIISRDNIMAKVTSQKMGKSFDEKRPTGAAYAEMYAFYQANKLGGVVNNEMAAQIRSALKKGRTVIIDTVMFYFQGFESIMPADMKPFVVGFHSARNVPFTEKDAEKNGTTLSNQLVISGIMERSLFSIIPESVELNRIVACTTKDKLPQTPFLSQPYMNFVRGFSQESSIGMDYFKKICKPLQDFSLSLTEKMLEFEKCSRMNIPEYFNYMCSKYSVDRVIEMFRADFFQCGFINNLKNTPMDKMVIKISYFEHNRLWRHKWARDCRGVILAYFKGKWIVLKYLLQRGAEILTGVQVTKFESSENVEVSEGKIANISMFDDVQQDTIRRIITNSDIEMAISCKRDGSLFGVNIYYGEVAEFVKALIIASNDPFANIILQMCEENKMDVMVLSTNGTYFMGTDMYDYNVHAMLSIIMSDEEIYKNADTLPIDLFRQHGLPILQKFCALAESVNINSPGLYAITISAETIVRDRLTFCGKRHYELATAYNSSSFTPLGFTMYTMDGMLQYFPHFCFSEQIVQNGFLEPPYWFISNASVLEKMIEDLDNVIFKKITQDEYFAKYPTQNKFSFGKFLDFEGFVSYRMEDGLNFDYSKAKTDAFYKAHDHGRVCDAEKIAYLIELAKVAGSNFPYAQKVKDFYDSIQTNLTQFTGDMISQSGVDGIFFDGLKESAKAAFHRIPAHKKFLALQNQSSTFMELAKVIYLKYFALKDDADPENISMILTQIMTHLHKPNLIESIMASDIIGLIFHEHP